MRMIKLLAIVVAIGLMATPQPAKAAAVLVGVDLNGNSSFITLLDPDNSQALGLGFSPSADLSQYHARQGYSYFAVGSVDGAVVKDDVSNTPWPGYGVGAVAFEPTGDVTATAIENIVQSIDLGYGPETTVTINFAAGVHVPSAVGKLGVETTGLTVNFFAAPGSLPDSAYTIAGQTLTLHTYSGAASATTPVVFKLSFINFSTPAGLPVGSFYVWGKAWGIWGNSITAAPELLNLSIFPASANFTINSLLGAFFDQNVHYDSSQLGNINATLIKAISSTSDQKKAVLNGIFNGVTSADHLVTLTEAVTVIESVLATPVTPPVTPPADNSTISGTATIPTGSTVTGNTIAAGATVTNNGTMVNPTNSGTITGGTLSGTVTNNGTVSNVTLGEGTTVTGGTVTGTLTGSGTGATLTDAVIDATTITGNVTIGSGCTITSSSAAANPGIDLTAAVTGNNDRISLNAPILADPATDTALSLRDLLRNSVNTLLGDSSCDVQEDVRGNGHIGAQNLGNIQLPGRITEVETTDQPDGADFDDDGNLVIRISGIAMTVTPTSQNADAFEAALAALSLAAEESSNGVVSITLPGVGRIALRFAGYSTLPATASIAQAGASFSLVGDPSNPETYHLVAIYPDGAIQPMLPFIHDLGEFGQLCGANAITYRVDPINGRFALMNAAGVVFYHGIPDYLVTDPPAGTTATFIESDGDANGDGLIDFFLITPTGKQLIYTLPN